MHSHYFVVTTELPADDIIINDTSMEYEDHDLNNHDHTFDSQFESILNPSPLSEIEKQRLRATWILKTHETNMLTQSCMENLLSDVTDICGNIIDELRVDIAQNLKSASISSSVIEKISTIFDDVTYRQPFIGLETQYKQLQFYRKHLNFVVKVYAIYVYNTIM